MLSLFVPPWPLFAPFLLCLPLAWSSWRSLRPAPFAALRLNSANEIECANLQGQWQTMQILPGSTVFSWMIVLRLRETEGEQRKNLLLLPDQMSKEAFRRLQRHLRWHNDLT